MWIDIDTSYSKLAQRKSLPPKKVSQFSKKFDNSHNQDLIDENKRLWSELKEKNELIISLRDDIYYKQEELRKLSKYRRDPEEECPKPLDNQLQLMREINELRSILREKQTMIANLNKTVESLCDKVVETEYVECMERDILELETENKKLSKENSDIKVKLQILEHDNGTLQDRFRRVEEEHYNMRKKLEKTAKKMKEKENSMLTYQKFTELAKNLQSRIARSKHENTVLKSVVEKMKNVANNYDQLENENTRLKRKLRDIELDNDKLKSQILSLQENQLIITKNEIITKPVLMQENSDLKQQLLSSEDKLQNLTELNAKLKASLQIYEKMLSKVKETEKKREQYFNNIRGIVAENNELKGITENLNTDLQCELKSRDCLANENEYLKEEIGKLLKLLKDSDLEKETIMKEAVTARQHCEEYILEIEDLKRQLQICKSTIQNQNITIGIRGAEIENLSKENKELTLNIKQYESQIQMDGKVHKFIR